MGAKKAKSLVVARPGRAAPRGSTSEVGMGTHRLYALNNRQEHKDSPNLISCMIQVFDFTVYALLHPRATLSFVTPYIAMKFDIIREQLSEPFSVSIPIAESILAKIVYRDCALYINHKCTMADLVDLYMVDIDVILDMDWILAFYASVYYRTRAVKF